MIAFLLNLCIDIVSLHHYIYYIIYIYKYI